MSTSNLGYSSCPEHDRWLRRPDGQVKHRQLLTFITRVRTPSTWRLRNGDGGGLKLVGCLVHVEIVTECECFQLPKCAHGRWVDEYVSVERVRAVFLEGRWSYRYKRSNRAVDIDPGRLLGPADGTRPEVMIGIQSIRPRKPDSDMRWRLTQHELVPPIR